MRRILILLVGIVSISTAALADKASEIAYYQSLVAYHTIVSVTDGDWEDPMTWDLERIPGFGDRVLVQNAVQITGINTDPVETIDITGRLYTNPELPVELHFETMLVNETGALNMGDENDPVREKQRLVVHDVDGGVFDDKGLSQGIINIGSVTIQGRNKTAWNPAEPVSAGDTSIKVNGQMTLWEAGDTIVITGVQWDGKGDEVRTISSIDHTSNIVYWEEPLTIDHIPEISEFSIHVANMTRDIEITSNEADHGDRLRYGYFITAWTNKLDIRYAAIHHMGRSSKTELFYLGGTIGNNPDNQIGLWPLEIHMGGVGHENTTGTAIVRGNVISDGPGWAYVNHRSTMNFEDNVAYNMRGAAFVTEDGTEDGVFYDNIAIRTIGSPGIDHRSKKAKFGHQGHGFWLQGLSVKLRGNVVAGSTGSGIGIWGVFTDGKGGYKYVPVEITKNPDAYGNAKYISIDDQPIEQMDDTIVYGAGAGMFVAAHRPYSSGNQYSEINNLKIYNVRTGIHQRYSGGLIYTGLTVKNDSNPARDGGTYNLHKLFTEGTGLDMIHKRVDDITIVNLEVLNFNIGVRLNNSRGSSIENAVIKDCGIPITGSVELIDPIIIDHSVEPPVEPTTIELKTEKIYFQNRNPKTIPVLINDKGDGLKVVAVSRAKKNKGAVILNADNTVTYNPHSGKKNKDSFTYTVEDMHGNNATKTVNIQLPVKGNNWVGYIDQY